MDFSHEVIEIILISILPKLSSLGSLHKYNFEFILGENHLYFHLSYFLIQRNYFWLQILKITVIENLHLNELRSF